MKLMSLYVWATVYACHHDAVQAGNHDMAWEAERGTAWLVMGSSAQQHPRSAQRCTPACILHTPSIAFRHLPPNSARFGYATEGAPFISSQLSTDAVSALRKVLVLI